VTAKPYDVTLKELIETDPESWPQLLGLPTGATDVIDADIATVSGAADKVLRVAAEPPYLLHLEFISGHDAATLPRKLLVRNAVLEERHDLPVLSAVLVLRPEADSPQLTGLYQRAFPGEEAYVRFRYQVVRVWQLSPEMLLHGGLALLPLAPISAVTAAELPGIMKEIDKRLRGRRARKKAPTLWSATYLLMGLRYPADLVNELSRGLQMLEESSTYQYLLGKGAREGALAEAHKLLRLCGEGAFGVPDAQSVAALEGLTDLTRMEELMSTVHTAGSWQEWLGLPPATPRRRRS
jgi:hypothetical protein